MRTASTATLELAAPAGLAAPQRVAFGDVYRQHARMVWRVLRRLGVPEADAEDVGQEVFTVVYRKLPQFSARSSLRTWICGIAIRCAVHHRRKAHVRREVPTESPAELPAEPLQVASVERREARACLDGLIAELDDDRRAVFVLYEIEELPMAEVAEALGCPLQTAYTRLHAARRQVEAAVARLQLRGALR